MHLKNIQVIGLITKYAVCSLGRNFMQVAMRHINLAVEEMFNASHMQLLSTCCVLEKLLLAALILESKARGKVAL